MPKLQIRTHGRYRIRTGSSVCPVHNGQYSIIPSEQHSTTPSEQRSITPSGQRSTTLSEQRSTREMNSCSLGKPFVACSGSRLHTATETVCITRAYVRVCVKEGGARCKMQGTPRLRHAVSCLIHYFPKTAMLQRNLPLRYSIAVYISSGRYRDRRTDTCFFYRRNKQTKNRLRRQ